MRSTSALTVMASAFAALLFVSSTSAAPITGRVIAVADGDTITVLDALKQQHQIRLSGIDAPEGGQAFGQNSKRTLSDCAFGKNAVIDGDKTDRYVRTVGRVIVAGVDCNLRQVELGMAWHYVKYASERPVAESKLYAAAEVAARTAKRGLWADLHAMPPWDWRAGGQQAQAAAKESSGECDCSTGKTCTGKRGGIYCHKAIPWQLKGTGRSAAPCVENDMSDAVTVTCELSGSQAQALAQFVKRVGWTEFRGCAIDDDEASEMRAGIDRLQSALAVAGYAPR